jgi:hypothetical protein
MKRVRSLNLGLALLNNKGRETGVLAKGLRKPVHCGKNPGFWVDG